jgi:hypothetical protein
MQMVSQSLPHSSEVFRAGQDSLWDRPRSKLTNRPAGRSGGFCPFRCGALAGTWRENANSEFPPDFQNRFCHERRF